MKNEKKKNNYSIIFNDVQATPDQEIRTDLKPFDLERLKELRHPQNSIFHFQNKYKLFFDELEAIIRDPDYKPTCWIKRKKDDICKGDVWQQPIGICRYKNTVHEYQYMYTETFGLVFAKHGHNEIKPNGQIRKVSEYYFFDNGDIWFCPKDKQHALQKRAGPMFIISLKIWNHGKDKEGIK